MLFCLARQKWNDYKLLKKITQSGETKVENARIFFFYFGHHISYRDCIEDTFFVPLKDERTKKFLDFVLKNSLKNEFTAARISQFDITSVLSNYMKNRTGENQNLEKKDVFIDEKIICYLEYELRLYDIKPFTIWASSILVNINALVSFLKDMKINPQIDYRAKDLLLEIFDKIKKENPKIQFLINVNQINFTIDEILYTITNKGFQLDVKYTVKSTERRCTYDLEIQETDYYKKGVCLYQDEFLYQAFNVVRDEKEAKDLAKQAIFLLHYIESLFLYEFIADRTDEIIKFILNIPDNPEASFLPVFDSPDARERAISEMTLFASIYTPDGPNSVKKVPNVLDITPYYQSINPFVDKIFDFVTKKIFEIAGTDFSNIYYNIQNKLSRKGVIAESYAALGDPYRIHIYFCNKTLVLEIQMFSNDYYAIEYILYRIFPGLLENFFDSLGLNKKEAQHIQKVWLLDSFYRFIR